MRCKREQWKDSEGKNDKPDDLTSILWTHKMEKDLTSTSCLPTPKSKFALWLVHSNSQINKKLNEEMYWALMKIQWGWCTKIPMPLTRPMIHCKGQLPVKLMEKGCTIWHIKVSNGVLFCSVVCCFGLLLFYYCFCFCSLAFLRCFVFFHRVCNRDEGIWGTRRWTELGYTMWNPQWFNKEVF